MLCPKCNKEFDLASSDAKPFCSLRCKTMDLGRWLDESYVLPDVPDPEDDETPDDNWAGKPLAELERLAELDGRTDLDGLSGAEKSTDV